MTKPLKSYFPHFAYCEITGIRNGEPIRVFSGLIEWEDIAPIDRLASANGFVVRFEAVECTYSNSEVRTELRAFRQFANPLGPRACSTYWAEDFRPGSVCFVCGMTENVHLQSGSGQPDPFEVLQPSGDLHKQSGRGDE